MFKELTPNVRVEFSGAVYHVLDRGDRREAIFRDDHDRAVFLKTLPEVSARTGWRLHAYVMMRNHDHFLLETPEPNLVTGMQWFQSTYSLRFNARHRLRGHVFQGGITMKALDLDQEELGRIKMNDPRKIMIGGFVRRHTMASNSWIADRLAMGDPTRVSRYGGSADGPAQTTLLQKLNDLEKKTTSKA